MHHGQYSQPALKPFKFDAYYNPTFCIVKFCESLFLNYSRKMTKWTLPYKDQLGLGTVLTVSVPFHDITSSNSPKFLGVAAVDLLLDDIRQAVSDATVS